MFFPSSVMAARQVDPRLAQHVLESPSGGRHCELGPSPAEFAVAYGPIRQRIDETTGEARPVRAAAKDLG